MQRAARRYLGTKATLLTRLEIASSGSGLSITSTFTRNPWWVFELSGVRTDRSAHQFITLLPAILKKKEIVTVDQRIERLTERHEALTQSAELVAAENRERDRRMGEVMEAIARLLHIAEIHEHRITRIEERQP